MSAEQKTIGGRLFSFGRLPATKALKLQLKLVKIIGGEVGSLAELASSTRKKGDVASFDLLGEIVSRVSSRVEEDALILMMEEVFSKVSCDGKPIILDQTFASSPTEAWKIFVEGLRVNLADFLAVLKSTLNREEIKESAK